MKNPREENVSRRSFLTGSAAGAAAAFQIAKPELARGQNREKLTAGIVGCGGRGTRGVAEMISGNPNVELVAMADLFEDQLERSLRRLRDSDEFTPEVKSGIQVAPENRFLGFDAYKKVIDSGVDIVLLHTPPGWRPLHFEYAVNAGKHIFAEKPLATDCVGAQKVLRLARESERKKLTVMIGAQRRAQKEYVETVKRIQDGAIGDIVATYANWVGGPVIKGEEFEDRTEPGSLEWQHRAWYQHVWICGDQIVEQHLHNIDVINWVMGAHPVSCISSGGAVWRPESRLMGNIYDHFCTDFVYENGVRMTSYCRQYPRMDGQVSRIDELVVGTKGRSNCKDMGPRGENPYVQEHIDMVNSILGTGPYLNIAWDVAASTMTAIMGREAAYSGLEITWDMVMNSKQDLMPKDPAYEKQFPIPARPVPGEYKFV
jgi:predicted dehydrogenase